MNNNESSDNTEEQLNEVEDESLFNNNIFLVFFSASITIVIVGFIFIGYCMYYYMDRPKSTESITTFIEPKEQTSTKKSVTWQPSRDRPANKVTSGSIGVNDKLSLTIDSVKLTSERNWDIEKSYGQVALVTYTCKNLGVTTGLEITEEDIEIRDRKGNRVDSYTLNSISPVYKILKLNEEYTVTYPIAIATASADLSILLKTRDGKLRNGKTLFLHMT